MHWSKIRIAADGSHHEADHRPLYAQRFDEVLPFHAPGLAPVRLGNDAWHIETDGRAAYQRRFDRVFGFYDGCAAVVSSAGWHHICPDGADLYLDRYAWVGNFQERRCTVRQEDGDYMHIGGDGLPLYDRRWRYCGDFRDGFAVVQASDGRSSHIDRHGLLVHQCWFRDLDVFHKGYARARDESGWMHVDKKARPAYARRFAAVEPFYNGQARVECFDGALEVIDESGVCVIVLRRAWNDR